MTGGPSGTRETEVEISQTRQGQLAPLSSASEGSALGHPREDMGPPRPPGQKQSSQALRGPCQTHGA